MIVATWLSWMFHPVFLPALLAYGVSLVGKILTYSFENKRLTFDRFWKDGGMPSSHSAVVSGMTSGIFFSEGASNLFWMACILSLIVMHDAIGVRFQTGKQAQAINTIIQVVQQRKSLHINHVKEILGHTPLQVIIGALIGVGVAWLTHVMFF